MTGGSSASRRWELTDQEWERVAAARGKPVGPGTLLATLADFPGLVLPLMKSALAGATSAVRNDGALVSIIDARRVRGVVPEAATGVVWKGEDFFVDAALRHVGPEDSVLEIGCGGGRISRHIAPKVALLVASDISKVMLAEARENLAGCDNVRYVQTMGYTLSELEDASFDAVISHDVFYRFELNPLLSMLDEVRRLLRPGGLSVISFVTIDEPAWAARQLDDVRTAARSGGFGPSLNAPLVSAQVEALLRAVGLDVIDTGYEQLDDPGVQPHFVVVGRR